MRIRSENSHWLRLSENGGKNVECHLVFQYLDEWDFERQECMWRKESINGYGLV